MSTGIEDLRLAMQAAVEAEDYEEAARLRDRISLLQGAPETDASAPIDTSRLKRHVPGQMGLGTSDQVMVPGAGMEAAAEA